jgi:hypothetical protein
MEHVTNLNTPSGSRVTDHTVGAATPAQAPSATSAAMMCPEDNAATTLTTLPDSSAASNGNGAANATGVGSDSTRAPAEIHTSKKSLSASERSTLYGHTTLVSGIPRLPNRVYASTCDTGQVQNLGHFAITSHPIHPPVVCSHEGYTQRRVYNGQWTEHRCIP